MMKSRADLIPLGGLRQFGLAAVALSVMAAMLAGCGGSSSTSSFTTRPGGGEFVLEGTTAEPSLALTYPAGIANVVVSAATLTSIPAQTQPNGVLQVGPAYKLSPSGATLLPAGATTAPQLVWTEPSTTFPYPELNNAPVSYVVFAYDSSTQKWVAEPTQVSQTNITSGNGTVPGTVISASLLLPSGAYGIADSGDYAVYQYGVASAPVLRKR